MKKPLVILLICVGCLYGCWKALVPVETWRYRLTINVNDNGTLRTGSSVIEVIGGSTRNIPLPIPGNTGGISLHRGEAVTIDLGKKGVFFVLLSKENDPGYAAYLVCEIFEMEPGHGCAGAATPEGIRYYAKLKGKANVPTKKLPMLVRFRDIKDPKTVEKIDPENLEASFGAGVTLENATIEMTDGEVTTGIEKWLSWMPEYYNKHFDGERYETIEATNRLANSLASGAFSTELSDGR